MVLPPVAVASVKRQSLRSAIRTVIVTGGWVGSIRSEAELSRGGGFPRPFTNPLATLGGKLAFILGFLNCQIFEYGWEWRGEASPSEPFDGVLPSPTGDCGRRLI